MRGPGAALALLAPGNGTLPEGGATVEAANHGVFGAHSGGGDGKRSPTSRPGLTYLH